MRFVKKSISCLVAAIIIMGSILSVILYESKEVSADEVAVNAFVSRLYEVTLDREADSGGLAYWADRINSGNETGISVAYNFIFSEEFQSKDCSNEDYIDYMYMAFFGRNSDSAGKAYWVNLMDSGVSREAVFEGFSNSDEFYDICNEYGIVAGTYITGRDAVMTARVNLFVNRLYTIILGRTCDKDGMAYWTNQLVSGVTTGGEAAHGFVFSDEYYGMNKSDAEYIDDLYLAFMGRPADDNGRNYWLSLYVNGSNDLQIFNSFLLSDEFTSICASYGITRGNSVGGDKIWAREHDSRAGFDRSVNLYFLDTDDEEILTIPSGYEKSHRIIAAPGARFRTSSSYITVDSNGVVSPKGTTWYWRGGFGTTSRPSDMTGVRVDTTYTAGSYTVTVTDSEGSYDVTINVIDYALTYCEEVKDSIIREIVQPGMTETEIATEITKYVAHHYSYGGGISYGNGMILYGEGDCWASTGLIISLCEKAGLRATSHNANWKSGAGSGHYNAICEADGKILELEAGYTGTAPRSYSVIPYNQGYRISSNGIISEYVSLDSINGEFVVPETIDGITVRGFSRSFLFDTVQATESTITSISIPSTVNSIADQSFYIYDESLTAINVAAGNTAYKSVNGIVYTKDGKTLVAVPHGYTFANGTFNIPSGVTKIMGYAVSYVPGLTSVNIPTGCTEIGEGAFFSCSNLTSITLPETLVTIRDGAFNSLSSLRQVVIPASVTSIGQYAFYGNSSITVVFRTSTVRFGNNAFSNSTGVTFVAPSGSTAEQYASSRSIVFQPS